MTPEQRKERPLARGVLDYFPDALMEVAYASWVATQQHHPKAAMHWERGKSTDHADCILRHLKDRGMLDEDGVRHTTKVAWRALALLQVEIEAERPRAPRPEPSEDKLCTHCGTLVHMTGNPEGRHACSRPETPEPLSGEGGSFIQRPGGAG